jgi:UDP-N-acetylglucosamine/UDP-N-acetylgalactosamine diphosphorylase
VGSSYIHFNYTPQQDKATASLIGDVPCGVMLKESPIFLGGQGGIVGPVQIDFGTVIPAGIICRQSTLKAGQLFSSPALPAMRKNILPGVYGDIGNKVYLNVLYIANMLALRQWYIHVRQNFFLKQKFGVGLYEGACQVIDEAVAERLSQMRLFAKNLETSLLSTAGQKKKHLPDNVVRLQKELLFKWPQMEVYLTRRIRAGCGMDLFGMRTARLQFSISSTAQAP